MDNLDVPLVLERFDLTGLIDNINKINIETKKKQIRELKMSRGRTQGALNIVLMEIDITKKAIERQREVLSKLEGLKDQLVLQACDTNDAIETLENELG